MMKLSNVSLLGSVLMAAAAEAGSNKPAKAKADTSKTKGAAAKPVAKTDAKVSKAGGGRKLPIFSDKAKIVQALEFIRDRKMDAFLGAGFSQHHIRQLGKGVSGGMFGPGAGLGYVEIVADTSARPEGQKGRRPMVPQLTKEGLKFLKTEEMKAARKAGETPAPKSEKSAPKSGNKPKAPKVEAKEVQPAAPAPEAAPEAPQTETAPVADTGNSEAAAA